VHLAAEADGTLRPVRVLKTVVLPEPAKPTNPMCIPETSLARAGSARRRARPAAPQFLRGVDQLVEEVMHGDELRGIPGAFDHDEVLPVGCHVELAEPGPCR